MTGSAITLQLHKPVGAYKVDDHASVLFPNAPNDVAIEAVRGEVNRAAEIAVVRERHERADLRKAREHAKLLFELLDNVERDAAKKWFPTGDVAVAAADISEGFVKPDDVAVSMVQPLVQIIDGINSLRSWAAELRRFDIIRSPPSNSDPLARCFVEAMGTAYLARRKKQPPHGRTGPFVDLIAAGWLDLGFPPPPSKADLKDWLGRKTEALPVLTTKKSSQTG